MTSNHDQTRVADDAHAPPLAARPILHETTTFASGPIPKTTVSSLVEALRQMHPAPQQEMVARLGHVWGNNRVIQLLARVRQPAVQRDDAEDKDALPYKQDAPAKDDSSLFAGDKTFEDVSKGAQSVKKGDNGTAVVRVQQALVDMGYLAPAFGAYGTFEDKTQIALKKFQTDAGLVPETGEFDKATIGAMNTKFDTRKPYVANAVFDPADPTKGTRALSAADKAAVKGAMVPARGLGGKSATFQDEVAGKKYGDEIRAALTSLVAAFHKELFEDKKPLRADPAKNFHGWNVLEQTAEASKDVTDALYGSYRKGPKMTAAAGNFVDQWEDEIARNSALSPAEKQEKARGKVWYLINSNCTTTNERHSAVPSDATEKAILTPIAESFIDTPTKVQTMLDLEIGWEGAQLAGTVYLQRYKSTDDDKNRLQLWELFHTCIHEYIHSLADAKYMSYANDLRNKGDETRYNTLVEGMDDFFTENVRSTVAVTDALQTKVEGPYYKVGTPAPAVSPATYASKAQAEQVVSIAGIRNAEAAYFKGDVKLIGG